MRAAWCLIAASACSSKKTEPPPAPVVAEAAVAVAIDAAEPALPATAIVVDGFSTPESVLHDAERDVYLVANINGSPREADDNGFISKVSPEGKVLEARWIDGAKVDVKLGAPKGMAVSGGVLWVADLTVVRKFDPTSGKPRGEVAIAGATLLNDVVADGQDGIYVSDTGGEAVHHVDAKGKVTTLVADKALGKPNGLAVAHDKVWIVTFGSGEVLAVGADGKRETPMKLPKGQLDGIEIDGDEVLVSSWEGKAIYTSAGGQWKVLYGGIDAPADIGLDRKRRRILIPKLEANQLVIVPR